MWTDFRCFVWIYRVKQEAKWKRFHPFRVVRKIFRRRIKREGTSVTDASKKSWSTSELQSVQDDGTGKREVTSPLKIGLSVSHDSIFSPETSTNAVSSETINVSHGSSLSVHHTTIKNMFKDELFTRVRARRDSDDDDAGLPHSPCTSPTTVDVLTQGLKEKSSKSQTTCSAGSLISMGSSENDEDSAGQSSGHSSRISLIDRRSLDSDGDTDSSQPVPLNHNAAHHKIAVRPKRTHGLPRRRMNQIAASKVSTLPSTPEVTEDSGKSFQKLDSVEVVKTFTEYSVSSLNEFSSSRQSSDWQVSHMTSSYSYNEVSDISREVISHKEKSTSESCTQIYKENIEEKSKLLSGEEIKNLVGVDNLKSEVRGISSQSFSSRENDSEFTNIDELKSSNDLKNDYFDRHQEDIDSEKSKLIKFENKEETENTLIDTKESFPKENETSLKVSSLVRNLEKSESFKNSEKLFKGKEDIKSTFGNSIGSEHIATVQMKTNSTLSEISEIPPKADELKESLFPKVQMEKTNELFASTDIKSESKTQSSQEFIKEVRISNVPNKLDIDSEFILKTVKKDSNSDKILELSSSEKMEDKENPLISSLYFEEESIMSSKSLSLGVEESGIFVSHHASFKDDLKDMVVTEAHNFAAVEENAGVFIQASGDILKDKKMNINEPWISSVDIPASISLDNDVTVNSSTSTLCSNKMNDEKITISVNSKSETITSIVSSHTQDDMKLNFDSENSVLASKHDVSQQPELKEKQPVKPTPKSQLHEGNSTITSMKNINAQKRVSVEIVPFSQRMKERKYQPISFGSKDSPSEQNKKSSNASVERKLSDRKVTVKNKELDKANNRHSFSGALITDNKKGESVTEKKTLKLEKVQYPVQIRIHKSIPKPEVKDKGNAASNKGLKNLTNKSDSSELKFKVQTSQVNSNEMKSVKEEKGLQESSAKWEVKIQPSVSHNKTPISDNDDSCSSISSETNTPTRNECRKSPIMGPDSKDSSNLQDMEQLSMKNHESNWKTSKETPLPLSDDPEPELLRVFARRSIKQKNCDKNKVDEPHESSMSDASLDDSSTPIDKPQENNEISVSDNSTVIKISEISKPHIKTHDLKKKSKSFCEKEKVTTRSVSPLKEINLIHRESPVKLTSDSSVSSETIHPRQRLASVPDIPLSLPPDSIKNSLKESSTENSPAVSIKEETQQRISSTSVPVTTGSMNGSVTNIGMVRESQETLNEKEPHAPSWLQLAQQRRELREQRERLLLGGSSNSFMDGSNKPSRSSKVWDMVNNFQKLQMT
ncbi:uncharacterized protein TNIN_190872 [Trichonephila inaurata madagascariensis]|uniref:DUF4592 domain-containing protein n=1 Tax=Trichonephila inaurata madagascariensis TaxID=2747483 RepID=A0A8X6XLP5_9ARAC|nr:uncharacterized protein TNIN_134392 [Trichonephila inaurata madagascariensis]GFY54927.1 uncharacterized protein TNIN_190872 [Trichonephila inaurata madagascariensis]